MNMSHTSLVQELRDAGGPVDDLWDLVNSRVKYPQAIRSSPKTAVNSPPSVMVSA